MAKEVDLSLSINLYKIIFLKLRACAEHAFFLILS